MTDQTTGAGGRRRPRSGWRAAGTTSIRVRSRALRYRERVIDDGVDPDAQDNGEAEARLLTGIRDQRLVLEGWFASHGDTGTRGPHVHLRTTDQRDAVLKTSQVAHLINQLVLVRDRIDALWEHDGQSYPFGDEPDDNEPSVIEARRLRESEQRELIRSQVHGVVDVLLGASDRHEAVSGVAELLGIDEVEALVRLSGLSLLDLTPR